MTTAASRPRCRFQHCDVCAAAKPRCVSVLYTIVLILVDAPTVHALVVSKLVAQLSYSCPTF
jgi:hypothetical protein